MDSVVGALLFGTAADKTGYSDVMLQFRLASSAPEVGECHFAFLSDCSPWASPDGMSAISERVPKDECGEACPALVGEWRDLEVSYVRGDRSECARWISGCPARVSPGGVGGNRWVAMTPEPISWELWLPASGNHRNAKRVSLANVDKLEFPVESLPQRSGQPSAGGEMVACSSKSWAKRDFAPVAVAQNDAFSCHSTVRRRQ